MDWFIYAIIAFIVLMSLAIKVAFGFGGSIISMVFLIYWVDLKTAIAITALSDVIANAVLIIRYRKVVRWGMFKNLIGGLLIGTLIGVLLLNHIDPAVTKKVLAIFILYFIFRQEWVQQKGIAISKWLRVYPLVHKVTSLSKSNLRSTRHLKLKGYFMSVGAGLFGGLTNVNGPLLVAYLTPRIRKPDALKGTLCGLFFIDAVWRSILLANTGIGQELNLLLATVLITAAVLLAIPIAELLLAQFSPQRFNQAIYTLLFIYSIKLFL